MPNATINSFYSNFTGDKMNRYFQHLKCSPRNFRSILENSSVHLLMIRMKKVNCCNATFSRKVLCPKLKVALLEEKFQTK